jgi:hypothetical protein
MWSERGKALHLTGPALRHFETLRSLQPVRQVKAGVGPQRSTGMRIATIAICALLLLYAGAAAQEKTPAKELLKDYRGEVQLPDDLYDAYSAFVAAVETADEEAIEKHCVPYSVAFTTDARPEATREYGTDINIPFLRRGFHKYILNLAQDSEDTYLIRTGSSYMRFVRTKAEGWKLYRYGDKPIQ